MIAVSFGNDQIVMSLGWLVRQHQVWCTLYRNVKRASKHGQSTTWRMASWIRVQ